MSALAYIFLPDVNFTNEDKTKQQIVQALNQKYPPAKFDLSKIKITRKQHKHNAYAETTEDHEQKLLDLKEIKIGGRTIPLKKCFPSHQIYINKLPDTISKQQASNYFGKFGKIVDIELFTAEGGYQNPKEKSNYNHCYIRFQKDDDAEKCLFPEERHSIKNKDDIRVVRAYKIGQNDETDKKLFLKIEPIVQFQSSKLEKQLYDYFKNFGQLRERIRIEQLTNVSSKAIITYTNLQSGQKALQQQKIQKIQQYSFILRPFATKENYTAFLGSLKGSVTEEDIKNALSFYGKVVNCTLNPSKKAGILNAVATFSDEQSFKLALSDYKNNEKVVSLFALKPYMDVHMNASLRNEFNNFKKKDKKPFGDNLMNIGGIGVGFGFQPRINQQPSFQYPMSNQQQFGFNPQLGTGLNPSIGGGLNPSIGLGAPLGLNPQVGGLTGPLLGNTTKMTQPPQNFRPY